MFEKLTFFRRKKKPPPPKHETVFAESLRSLQQLISETDRDTRDTQTTASQPTKVTPPAKPATSPSAPAPPPRAPAATQKPALKRAAPPPASAPKLSASPVAAPPAPAPKPAVPAKPSPSADNRNDLPVLTDVVRRRPVEASAIPTAAAMAARIVDQVSAEVGKTGQPWTPEMTARLTKQIRGMLETWTGSKGTDQAAQAHHEPDTRNGSELQP